jgi:hypothetical protein
MTLGLSKKEGSYLLQRLRQVLPLLPKPWVEVRVGGGRFAQASDIDIGLDPSSGLLEMARN